MISHASKVMLKILQARLQQYVNHELPDVQAGFRKGRGTRDQIANISWIIKQKTSRKTSFSALLTMPKPLTVRIIINCGKFWKRWEYQTTWPASWEICMNNRFITATVRTGRETTDWFQIGKGVHQRGILSPCLFNLHAEYSLVVQRLKHLPAMQETWVRSLSQEVPLEKEMATHSSILAWRIPWMEELDGLQSMGSQRVGHDWATSLSLSYPL